MQCAECRVQSECHKISPIPIYATYLEQKWSIGSQLRIHIRYVLTYSSGRAGVAGGKELKGARGRSAHGPAGKAPTATIAEPHVSVPILQTKGPEQNELPNVAMHNEMR